MRDNGRQRSYLMVLPVVAMLLLSGWPACADDAQSAKDKARTQFGEEVILKMTEPPKEPANSDSQSSSQPATSPASGQQPDGAAPSSQNQSTGAAPAPAGQPTDASLSAAGDGQASSSGAKAATGQTAAGQAAAGQASASQAGRAKPQQQTLKLEGRIEVLRENDVVSPPTIAAGEGLPTGEPGTADLSYPESYFGKWSGRVTIDQVDGGTLRTKYPGMWRRVQGIQFPGRVGMMKITFSREGKRVIVSRVVARFEPLDSDKQYADPASGAADAQQPMIMAFGAFTDTKTVLFKSMTTHLVLNKVKALTSDVYEQEIVTNSEAINSRGETVLGTSEAVLRFQVIGENKLSVTLARVDYNQAGQMAKKVMLHGTALKE
jgi:hypothetical protein